MTRRLVPGAFVLVTLTVPAAAQGPAIDHKPVGCIVAGNFPKLTACFSPSTTIARARVNFKATSIDGVPSPSPHWYWVDFKPESPCFTAILPKPAKKMTQMAYYINVADKQFREGRNAEQLVKVVPDKGGCDKDVPVAGWVQNASVVVGAPAGAPAVPVGFGSIVGAGGGVGATTLAIGGVVGGGAAATAIIVGGGGDEGDPDPTPTPNSVVVTVPTPTPTPPPTATPTPRPAITPPPLPFKALISVFPKFGSDPLNVQFDCCASTGTNLRFEYDFDGDGAEDMRGVCRTTRVYTLKGVSFAPLVTTPTQTKDYFAKVTVREALADGNRTTETHQITVEGPLGVTVQAQRPQANRRVSWSADLAGASGASAQVVVNGSTAVYARAGRSHGTAVGRPGLNRLEMQLVQGSGPGQVTFDLRSMPSLVPGSLRVVAGEMLAVSDTAITFRLKGTSGERVVFTVEAAE